MKRVTAWLLNCAILASANGPTVKDHRHGSTYVGIHRSEVETFLSIPYGRDTSGEHRFKAPRPYIPEQGCTIEATTAGPACPQQLGPIASPLILDAVTKTSEDCLHLNVYRPNGTCAGDKLPVLVYIHGGSLVYGSKDDTNVQPPGLILESIKNGNPVMAVNINYRLGVFGFAVSDALRHESSLNAGIKDQRLALEWVKENIELFGGDSSRITIYGQSSGGLSVGLQIMAYGAAKPAPFQQAICESQALEPGITGNVTQKTFTKLVDSLPCNNTDSQSTAAVDCLRNVSMEDLFEAQNNVYSADPSDNSGDQWLPTLDNDILPDAPSTLIQEGRFNNITTMIGWCQDDTNFFIDETTQTANDTLTYFTELLSGMSASNVNHLLSLYPISEFHANKAANLSAEFYRSGRILRDVLMTCQPIYYAEALSRADNPIYLYVQNQTILTPVLAAFNFTGEGVIHESDLAYVFGNLSHYDVNGLPFHPKASDYALARRQSRSWSTFATLGYPSLQGHDTLQAWTPAFARANETDIFVVGGPHEGLSAEDGPRAKHVVEVQKLRERCAFLNQPEIVKQLRY